MWNVGSSSHFHVLCVSGGFVSQLLTNAVRATEPSYAGPHVHIFSAHDSSLLGLMGAFELAAPSAWPEYCSILKIELLEHVRTPRDAPERWFLRFSLNGEVLASPRRIVAGEEEAMARAEGEPTHAAGLEQLVQQYRDWH